MPTHVVPTFRQELFSAPLWRSLLAEIVATFLYVFITCSSQVSWTDTPPTVLQISLASGLAYATMVQCFGHISGGHLNPAVTLAMLVSRKISITRGVTYVMAQCIASIGGSLLLCGFTKEIHHNKIGKTEVSHLLTPWQGMGIELILTFILVFTIFASVDPQVIIPGSASLAIGISVIITHLGAFNLTGASLNPARSLGPAVVLKQWQNLWVYWMGPLLGALLAAFTYEYLLNPQMVLHPIKKEGPKKVVFDAEQCPQGEVSFIYDNIIQQEDEIKEDDDDEGNFPYNTIVETTPRLPNRNIEMSRI